MAEERDNWLGMHWNPLEQMIVESQKARRQLKDLKNDVIYAETRVEIFHRRVEECAARVAAIDLAIAALKERFPEWAPAAEAEHALT